MKHARPRWPRATRATTATTAATTLLLALTACSVAGGGEEETTTGSAADGSTVADRDVTLLVHDSWYMPKKVLRSFEQETGYRVEVQTNGDAGVADQQAGADQGQPARRRRLRHRQHLRHPGRRRGCAGAVHVRPTCPPRPRSYALEGEAGEQLTPVDYGRRVRQRRRGLVRRAATRRRRRTLDDLAEPAYEDLFVTPAASTSSPGLRVPARHDRRSTARTAGRTTGRG